MAVAILLIIVVLDGCVLYAIYSYVAMCEKFTIRIWYNIWYQPYAYGMYYVPHTRMVQNIHYYTIYG